MTPEEQALLADQLSSGSALEAVVRGHLWVEAELITLLEQVLPFPEQIDLARLRFNEKVALAAAHGFIRPDDVPAYKALNNLRNRAAHNLAGEPDAEAVLNLKNSLGAHLRWVTHEMAKGEDKDWRWSLQLIILALCIGLDVERRKHEEYRVQVRAANQQLREAAQRIVDWHNKRA